MPRSLPWMRREQVAQDPQTKRATPPVRRVKKEGEDGSATRGTARSAWKREASSSPSGPPRERPMIEGLDGDDRYRMVEDELLATARDFTRHLHAAEYKRLQSTSNLKNAQAIGNITKARSSRKDESDTASDTDDATNSWQRKSLHGLLEGPGKTVTRLDQHIETRKSTTRAAAGFARPSSSGHPESQANRAGDPSTSSTPRKPAIPTLSQLPTRSSPVSSTKHSATQYANSHPEGNLRNKLSATLPKSHMSPVKKSDSSDDDDDDDFIGRLHKEQAERRRRRQRRSLEARHSITPR
ncbi:hypothetical protein F5Y16DRAFT_403982 [Xylariaceae sp. FL0255]|nr:hypothetical protein F5Y16DRAFT_403982 [Xylariaceae sp. FL0255]